MVGHTLLDIRARLAELSVAVGPYRVVSAKTGHSPVPVSGLQFPTRATAAEAASVATAYRTALRRYDPAVRVQDLIACDRGLSPTDSRLPADDLPEYCHSITAALLETLSRQDGRVQRTVMDRYLEAAETTPDRDRLSLLLIESLAEAIDSHYATRRQYELLRATADRLPGPAETETPVRETLSVLRSTDLLRDFEIGPAPSGGHRVGLHGYRVRDRDGDCIVLPIAVELLRRQSPPPRFGDATRTVDGWTVRLVSAAETPEPSLAIVPSA
ncbi:hypothetical protein ACFQL1_19160 [Halomicroarcula sp. GCM10025709]|uniref:DUF7551 domain-containing protein n=1 Tax=Haloarcula TaxID=2237 RepID=UPI0024C2AED3|nr:hypothetical protein [Halomicroarcula sp. YJ-61-S]